MFTPPPSPLPARAAFKGKGREKEFDVACSPGRDGAVRPISLDAADAKRLVGRRTRWVVVLVPLVLILITASTRYVTHPIALDVFADSPVPYSDWTILGDWRTHKPHLRSVEERDDNSSSSSPTSTVVFLPSTTGITLTSMGSSQSTASTALPVSQALPSVPASPPVLPIPFPQGLDSLSQDFTSESCYNFFLNMTETDPFRECRSFALLLQSSSAFVEAQGNLTLLNDVMWGTCNTDLSESDCDANMDWFASTLQQECSDDLSQKNANAVNTLMGLQAYSLMRQAGCLVDPVTDVYCYMQSVHSNSSDLDFWQLPFAIELPTGTLASCDSCAKSLLALYAPYAGNLTGLKSTYSAAEQVVGGQCGKDYLPTENAENGALGRREQVVYVAAFAFAASTMLHLL